MPHSVVFLGKRPLMVRGLQHVGVRRCGTCQLHGIEPWAYLRDGLSLLPTSPRRHVFALAPKFWAQTTEQPDTQRLPEADILHRGSLVGR